LPFGKPTRSRSRLFAWDRRTHEGKCNRQLRSTVAIPYFERLLPILALLAAICSPLPARATAPSIEYLFPAGGQQGTTVTVAAGGKADAKDAKIDPWPAKVWADCPGLEFKAAEANGTFTATIAKDCPPGPHLVRIYNDDGPSAPRVFVVGRHPEALEQEPNDDAGKAQPLDKLPTVVNGQLDKANDVDSYAIDVEAGRWIVAELLCRRINSPVDPALHLLDPDGVEIAFNHDTFGLDPFITCRAPRSGRYVLQVVGFAYPPGVDVRFAGGNGTVYRLSVTTGPYARYAMPLGVRRGEKTDLTLFGWNLGPDGRSAPLQYDGGALPLRADSIELAAPAIDNVLRLPVADLPQRVEEEPNDAADQAQHVETPVAITGRIGRPGDVDRFAFAAKKGEELAFALTSPSRGFPLDATLRVEDAAGKPLARDGDANGVQDPKIGWSAPADGTYVVAVSDQGHGGGDDYVYRLEIRRPTPDFRATADAASVKIEPGKSAEVKVTVARQGGYAAPLAVLVTGLPDGVTASGPAVPAAGGGAITVTLSTAASAKPANVPLRVLVVSTDEDHPAARTATIALLPADQLVTKTDTIWLTVAGGAIPATNPAGK
jgi:hypothetical protein